MEKERAYEREEVETWTRLVLGETLHPKQLQSVTDGVDGVLHAAYLGIRAIGRGLAAANGLTPKHAIKQVDRLLSNRNLPTTAMFEAWLAFATQGHEHMRVNFDWTELAAHDQSLLVLGLQHRGRSIPLVWKTFTRSQRKGRMHEYEDELLCLLHDVMPEGKRVTLLADRGFADSKLFAFLSEELGFDYILRLKKNVFVTNTKGETKAAGAWRKEGEGRMVLKGAEVTKQKVKVGMYVCASKADSPEVWCLVSSRDDMKASEVAGWYMRRFTIEETFRDLKNARYGLGLSDVATVSNTRRDGLVWLAVLAHGLLTCLGKAGEEAGMSKYLGATRPGELSLFRMGLLLFEQLPRMPASKRLPLLRHFAHAISSTPFVPFLPDVSDET